MVQDGNTWHCRWALVPYAALLFVTGCSSTQPTKQSTGGAARSEALVHGAGSIAQGSDALAPAAGAIAQGGGPIAQSPECNQTDSTISCCLKKHPGEYERCGATAPKQPPKKPPKEKPKRLPPLTDLTPEEAREREEQCRETYYRCLDLGGEYERRGMYGKTICQSCWQRCKAEGSWPQEVNDFPCLGG
jgi:hypothetical protein